ncbi:MAG: hypothetical protein D6729_13115 [Deltaproteobacteria bacterium]|nr:MAG: hypothetical protein D6729_13115 [Deltaproteobacteria bacterium]
MIQQPRQGFAAVKAFSGVAAAALLLCAALWLPLHAGAAEEAARAPAGTVTYFKAKKGAKAFRIREKQREALRKGVKVYEGDRIVTQGKVKMEVRLKDGSALRVGPDSEVLLEAAQFDLEKKARKVSASLIIGKAWSKVSKGFTAKDGGAESFQVHTENAVAGVRGTTFRVNALVDKSTLVRVYAGTVAVRGIRPLYQTEEPDAKSGRRQVKKPAQISRKEWERTVTKMMSIKIGANGLPEEEGEFALADELKGEEGDWVAWNRALDEAEGHE